MPSRIGDNVEDSDDNDVIDDDDAEENYVKDLVKLNLFARRVPVYDLGSGCGPDGGGDDDGNEETSDHREAAPRLEARSPKVVIGRITVTHCVVGHASPD